VVGKAQQWVGEACGEVARAEVTVSQNGHAKVGLGHTRERERELRLASRVHRRGKVVPRVALFDQTLAEEGGRGYNKKSVSRSCTSHFTSPLQMNETSGTVCNIPIFGKEFIKSCT
jgi:hypothetical protein